MNEEIPRTHFFRTLWTDVDAEDPKETLAHWRSIPQGLGALPQEKNSKLVVTLQASAVVGW